MAFNGMMEPGPWYHEGVEIGVEDVPEDDLLYEFEVSAIHPAVVRDDESNFMVPSGIFMDWLRARGWNNETVRMTNSYQVYTDPANKVCIMFENKRAAQLFKVVWL